MQEMKSLSTDKRKALIISLSKITSCITPLYAYHYTGVNAALSVEIPASQNVHLTKQVFEKLPLGAKLKYLLGGQYQPQSSYDLPGLSKLKSHLAQNMTDTALSKIEGIVALFGALSSVSDATGFLSVLVIYAKTHKQQSLITQLSSIVQSLFNDYGPQSSGDKPDWLKKMKRALYDWKLIINNPGFAHISRVLSLLVTLGVIDDVSINLGRFEIFAVEAQKGHVNAIDLTDAIIDTVCFFAEGGYSCFVTGSIAPLLFSTPKLVEMEELYLKAMSDWEHARNGNLGRFSDTTEQKFDYDIKSLIEEFHDLYKTTPAGTEKKIILQRWEQLSKVYTEFTSTRIAGGLRKSPFCVKIYGDSGVGKSTFADITMSTSLKSIGAECGPDFICTLNETDKYMSNYRSYITGVKLDDLGNAKKEFWEMAPSESIIKLVNNVKEYAVMADLANKGKISIEPNAVTITSNVEELHAGLSSYNAMSVLRRCHVHVELKVRPEFLTNNLLDTAKVLDKFGTMDKLNDIWLVTMKTPVGDGPRGQSFSHYDIIHKDISITEYVNIIADLSKKHNNEQEKVVVAFTDPSNIVNLCKECNKCMETCTCTPSVATTVESDSESDEDEDYEPQFGERLAGHIVRRGNSYGHKIRSKRCVLETKVEDLAIDGLLKGIEAFENSLYSSWTSYIPEQWMDNNFIKSNIMTYGHDVIGQEVSRYIKRMCFTNAAVSLGIYKLLGAKLAILYAGASGIYHMTTIGAIVETKKTAYFDRLVEARGTLPELFKTIRDKHVKYAVATFAALGALYGAAKTYKAIKANLSFQGKLNPTSIEDIRARDKETNAWVVPEYKPMSNIGSFSDQTRAANSLSTAQCLIDINGHFSGGFFVKSKCILIPGHLLPRETSVVKITNKNGTLKTLVNPKMSYKLPNTDAALIYAPNACPSKDMLKHFEEDFVTRPIMACVHGLREDQTRFAAKTWWHHTNDAHNGAETFPGAFYDLLGMKTFEGMCMSAIVSDSKECKILGFHIGGVTGTNKGCGFAITAPQLRMAIHELENMSEAFVPAPQARDIDDSMLGRNYAISGDIHYKCPTNFITGEAAVIPYGTVTGRSSTSSSVMETPISSVVERITGVPNVYGPPQFVSPVVRDDGKTDQRKWRPWYESLEVCSKPSIGFDPAEVDIAVDDYIGGLKKVFDSDPVEYSKELVPLTHQETISGVEGKRFIDAMVTKTSIGYPIGGPKSNHMFDLEPTDSHHCPREFTPEILAEIERVTALIDAGEHPNLIFGASLKDEPTKRTKDKVRVFQAAPLALQYLIRMYFLPVARFLSLHPLISECAVGINAHGPEWDELSRFMAQFGDDRIIAGDYSKYDLRMPAQLTLAAFSVMIRIAKWSGNYTAKDIQRMNVLAHEVCTPLVAYNGTLIRFLGTNPSGQNMTVYINSIVNSILHRLAFFDAYPKSQMVAIGKELGLGRPANARDLMALETYGDDAYGSVRRGYDRFNHVQMANYLADHDMKFTMPDKESAPIPFLNRYDADFLKRKNRYSEELGHYVGMLEEESIFKSLHSILRSKQVTPLEVCTQNVDGALREWFFHGREVFEHRRAQMQQIAAECELPCRTLDQDYDSRVEEWKLKYKPQAGKRFDQDAWCNKMNVNTRDLQDLLMLKHQVMHTPSDANAFRKLELINERLHELSHFSLEADSYGYSCLDDDENSDISEITIPQAITQEDELLRRVICDLGKPTAMEYSIILDNIGRGDLLYMDNEVAIVIECKRVIGRNSCYTKQVVEQAIKYANALAVVRPDLTVYGLTYTEYGYTIVEVIGEPKFPEKYAQLLDSAPIMV
jgi:hypothetical protein